MVTTNDILLSVAKQIISCRSAYFEDVCKVHRAIASKGTIGITTVMTALESELNCFIPYYYCKIVHREWSV